MDDTTLATTIENTIKQFNKTLITQQQHYQFSKYSKEELIKNFYTLNIQLAVREHLLQWCVYDLTMNTKDVLLVRSETVYNALKQKVNPLYSDLDETVTEALITRIYHYGDESISIYPEKNYRVLCLDYTQILFKTKLQKKTVYQYLAQYFPNLSVVVGFN